MGANTQRRREPGQVSSVAAEKNCSTARPTREEAFAAFCVLLAFATGQGDAPAADPIITTANVAAEFPGLTPRAFADAARRGDFAARRHGRKPAAFRSDVEAWLEARKVTPRPRKAAPVTIDPMADYVAMAGGR